MELEERAFSGGGNDFVTASKGGQSEFVSNARAVSGYCVSSKNQSEGIRSSELTHDVPVMSQTSVESLVFADMVTSLVGGVVEIAVLRVNL